MDQIKKTDESCTGALALLSGIVMGGLSDRLGERIHRVAAEALREPPTPAEYRGEALKEADCRKLSGLDKTGLDSAE
jgi:hypothetical protein